MVEDNKDVYEMKEYTKFAGNKERDSACVTEQRKNDLTMMGNEKESRCVTENRNNELTMMEQESRCVTENRNNELTMMEKDIAMKEKGKGNVKHNQDTIMENDKSKSSDTYCT